MKSGEKILSLKAAAKAIGVKPESLQAEAEANRVPHTRIGSEYVFTLSALEGALVERVSRAGGKGAGDA